jgi:hypothetical protein
MGKRLIWGRDSGGLRYVTFLLLSDFLFAARHSSSWSLISVSYILSDP